MKFYFCETCGKRLTDAEIAGGMGADKQVKGVYCTACAEGVHTIAFDSIRQDEAVQLLASRKQEASQVPAGNAGRYPEHAVRLQKPRRAGRAYAAGPGQNAGRGMQVAAGMGAGLLLAVVFVAIYRGSSPKIEPRVHQEAAGIVAEKPGANSSIPPAPIPAANAIPDVPRPAESANAHPSDPTEAIHPAIAPPPPPPPPPPPSQPSPPSPAVPEEEPIVDAPPKPVDPPARPVEARTLEDCLQDLRTALLARNSKLADTALASMRSNTQLAIPGTTLDALGSALGALRKRTAAERVALHGMVAKIVTLPLPEIPRGSRVRIVEVNDADLVGEVEIGNESKSWARMTWPLDRLTDEFWQAVCPPSHPATEDEKLLETARQWAKGLGSGGAPGIVLPKEHPLAAIFGVETPGEKPAGKKGSFTFLSEMEATDVRTGANGWHIGKLPNRPIEVQGETFTKGLYMRPQIGKPAHATYHLNGAYRTFKSQVGIADNSNANARVPYIFKVLGDGNLLWTSAVLDRPGAKDSCEVKVSGAQKIELVIELQGNASPWSAHPVWMDPQVLGD